MYRTVSARSMHIRSTPRCKRHPSGRTSLFFSTPAAEQGFGMAVEVIGEAAHRAGGFGELLHQLRHVRAGRVALTDEALHRTQRALRGVRRLTQTPDQRLQVRLNIGRELIEI